MANSLKVFLCSTYSDLVEERQGVIDAIRQLKLQHESMEFFGARPDQPIDTCLTEVARSNILVVVVGYRYGSIVPGREISFSEAEYQEGRRLDKFCLVYMLADDVKILPKCYEDDPDKLRQLLRFKSTLNAQHTVAKFSQVEDLAKRVKADLLETIELAEAEQQRRAEAEEERSAFFSEIQTIAESALSDGFNEALVLSTFRDSLSSLRPHAPTISDRISAFFRGLLTRKPAISDKKAPTVFLSYAHPDQAIVDDVSKGLRRYGVKTWMDRDQLAVGISISGQIEAALTDVDAFVLFASHSSLSSQWVDHEMKYFVSKRLEGESRTPIIPVVLDDVELPAILRDVLYVDLRGGNVVDAARRIAAAAWKVEVAELR